MSTGNEYNDDFDSFDKEPGGERYEEPWESAEQPGPKKKPGMSSGVKVLIILLCVFGGFAVICCGVGIWVVSNTAGSIKEKPEDVIAVTKEIADIEIPEDRFQPEAGLDLDWWFMQMKMAMYTPTDSQGMLMLMEMNVSGGNPEDQKREMRQAMRQQNFGEQQLDINKSESRTFNIRGEEASFQFAEAEDPQTGTAYRQVSGVFPGKSGTAFLQIQIEEEAYDEEAVVEMIKSIK